jgi:hypothetical protein
VRLQVVSQTGPCGGADDELLLAVLNSTPVVGGVTADLLEDLETAQPWMVRVGGLGTAAELGHVRRARAALQGIVRGELPALALGPLLRGVAYVPRVVDDITWVLRVTPERALAVRAILAFGAVERDSPGRLRPCANDECRLFLIDRSRANRARWCSMAVCGNRMKARRHYQRTRDAGRDTGR